MAIDGSSPSDRASSGNEEDDSPTSLPWLHELMGTRPRGQDGWYTESRSGDHSETQGKNAPVPKEELGWVPEIPISKGTMPLDELRELFEHEVQARRDYIDDVSPRLNLPPGLVEDMKDKIQVEAASEVAYKTGLSTSWANILFDHDPKLN